MATPADTRFSTTFVDANSDRSARDEAGDLAVWFA
jgi:hypothetical protein